MRCSARPAGPTYDLKLPLQSPAYTITDVECRGLTLPYEVDCKLQRNEIEVCNFATSGKITFDCCTTSNVLDCFILVERSKHEIMGTGLTRQSLGHAENIHPQALAITRSDRERLNGHKGRVIWLTGLSGAGKSTLANAVEAELISRGMRTYVLDGDNIRHGLNRDLGFTDEDRIENIRRVAEVAKLMLDAGLIVMTAFISPFRRERELAKQMIGPENFFEVYVSTPLEVCEQRDTKGLYLKARQGKIPNMTGVTSPYEPPDAPSCEIRTHELSIKECVKAIVHLLEQAD